MSDASATEVIEALERQKIAANKIPEPGGTHSIVVSRGDIPRALALLRAQRLPQRNTEESTRLRTFGEGGGLLPSRIHVQAAYEAAIAAELSESLKHLPGVSEARVHIGSPSGGRHALMRPKPITASILLSIESANADVEEQAKKLVSSAIVGLEVSQIQVVQTPTPPPKAAAPHAPSSGNKPVLAGSLLVNAVFAVLLIVVVRRRQTG